MTPEERKEARERCEKATPGPWGTCTGSGRIECTAVHSDAQEGIICDLLPDYELSRDSHKPILDNLKFIAHARTDLPAALKQIEDDEARMRQAMGSLDVALNHGGPTHLLHAALDTLRARLGEAEGQAKGWVAKG